MDRIRVRQAATELLRTGGRQWNAVSDGMLSHVLAAIGAVDPLDRLGLPTDTALAYATGQITRDGLPAVVRKRLAEIASYDEPKAEPKLIVAVACVLQGDTAPREQTDGSAFALTESHQPREAIVSVRVGQEGFRIRVVQRYGPRCALCDVSAIDLLDAAHLVPYASGGSDDPRNGLVLCANHHRALDRGLVRIDPESYSVVATGPFDLDQLSVLYHDLSHLPARPHAEALRWRLGLNSDGKHA